MTIRRRNPRLQGLIGLGAAVDWFTRHGYFVAIPLNDSQPWDLIIEDEEGRLSRVQVKTTTAKNRVGNYVVSLCTNGGNQSFHTKKLWDPHACELLFVVTDDGDVWLFPSDTMDGRTAISLCGKYERYRITGPRQLVVGEGFEPSKA